MEQAEAVPVQVGLWTLSRSKSTTPLPQSPRLTRQAAGVMGRQVPCGSRHP